MATPYANSVGVTGASPTGNNHADSLLSGLKWDDGGGSGVTLTYSFMGASSGFSYPYGQLNEPYTYGYYAFSSAQQTATANALKSWSNVADIKFAKTVDSSTTVGELRFGTSPSVDAQSDASGTVLAYTYELSFDPSAGDVWFNTGFLLGKLSTLAGSLQSLTLIHEIGHALGLKHPFEDSPQLPAGEDYFQYSVMSYYSRPNGGDFGTYVPDRFPTTPMVDDILAMQSMYGANTTFNATNTTYTFSGTGKYFQTIWDAGGTDTITYNSTTGGLIDLRPGNFSQLGAPINYYDSFTSNFSGGAGNYTGVSDPNTVAIAYGANIENANGGSGGDTIIGNDLNNILNGNAGNDTISGGLGDDTINGGTGADTMSGGDGNDIFTVDNAGDTVSENFSEGTDLVKSSISYVLGPNIENLTLTGNAAINGTGNGDANIITGNAAANTLLGGGGDDTLVGGGGNDILDGQGGADTMSGGAGNDTYYIDASDTISEAGGSGIDTVVTSASYTLPTGFENLVLQAGAGGINGFGNTLANKITSNEGANTLTGDLGKDIFRYVSAGDGNDTITDFTKGQDKFNFVSSNFGALKAGTLSTANFALNAAVDANDYFIFNTSNFTLYYDSDGSGAGGGVSIATLSNGVLLASSDIQIVAA